MDLSAGMLAVAAGRVAGRLVRADARHLPLPDGVADAAVTVATLEFADAATVLGELARITRPGGRVVAVTLNPHSLWGLLDRPTRREPFSSGTYLTRDELRQLGGRHGRARVRGLLFTAGPRGRRLPGPLGQQVVATPSSSTYGPTPSTPPATSPKRSTSHSRS